MSIGSVINNTIHSVKDTISNVLRKSQSNIESIVGTTSTGINSIFNGGFVGMSEEGMEDVYIAIKQYIDELEAIIDSVNYYEKLDAAYKGKVQEEVIEYIESVKGLLRAYISQLNQEIAEAKEAFNNYLEATQSISSDVQMDADELRGESQNIKL